MITIEQFESLLTPSGDEENEAVIDIVTYDREGTSVFKVSQNGRGQPPVADLSLITPTSVFLSYLELESPSEH